MIPCVGVDLQLFTPMGNNQGDNEKRDILRRAWGIPEHAFHIVSAGELNDNKNQKVVIEAISNLINKNIYYSIC